MHTPGPWYRESDVNRNGTDLVVLDNEHRVIADLRDADGVESADEAAANACLVAAAPDLLAAARHAESVLVEIAEYHEHPDVDGLLHRLRSAIASAEREVFRPGDRVRFRFPNADEEPGEVFVVHDEPGHGRVTIQVIKGYEDSVFRPLQTVEVSDLMKVGDADGKDEQPCQ